MRPRAPQLATKRSLGVYFFLKHEIGLSPPPRQRLKKLPSLTRGKDQTYWLTRPAFWRRLWKADFSRCPQAKALALAGIGSLAFNALTPQQTLAAPALTVKDNFNWSFNSFAELTPAGNGRFYGTTNRGGAHDAGTIFEFDPSGGGITLKASFAGPTTTTVKPSALSPAGNGRFYGTTYLGGNSSGTIFEFDPSGGGITNIVNFYCIDRLLCNPFAALTPAGNGRFYGTTTGGGSHFVGTIFEFDPSGGGITVKASFDVLNGAIPYAALTPAGNGLFYGTTYDGGANGVGTIYEFDPSGGGITIKATFNGDNGSHPLAALTPAGNGRFYGTTVGGGSHSVGTIFEFDPSGGGITVKASFDVLNGAQPAAALTSAGNGLFYGTTSFGGANNGGTIFEFSDPDPTPSPSVPGPLPLMGAAAACGWSRRLRRRIRLGRLGAVAAAKSARSHPS